MNTSYWDKQSPFFVDIPESHQRVTLSDLEKIYADPHQRLFVLKIPEIVGVILIELPPKGTIAKLGLFAFDRKHRGENEGLLLLQHAENCAKLAGKQTIRLEVFVFAQKLIVYYEKLGYYLTGKTASFFHKECIKPEFQNPKDQYLVEMMKSLI